MKKQPQLQRFVRQHEQAAWMAIEIVFTQSLNCFWSFALLKVRRRACNSVSTSLESPPRILSLRSLCFMTAGHTLQIENLPFSIATAVMNQFLIFRSSLMIQFYGFLCDASAKRHVLIFTITFACKIYAKGQLSNIQRRFTTSSLLVESYLTSNINVKTSPSDLSLSLAMSLDSSSFLLF